MSKDSVPILFYKYRGEQIFFFSGIWSVLVALGTFWGFGIQLTGAFEELEKTESFKNSMR